jgi:hypothetical protein
MMESWNNGQNKEYRRPETEGKSKTQDKSRKYERMKTRKRGVYRKPSFFRAFAVAILFGAGFRFSHHSNIPLFQFFPSCMKLTAF